MMNDDDFIPEVSNDAISPSDPVLDSEEIPVVEAIKTGSSRSLATEKGSFVCDQCDFFAKTKLGLAKHKVSLHGAPNKKDKKRARDLGTDSSHLQKEIPQIVEGNSADPLPPPSKKQKSKPVPGVASVSVDSVLPISTEGSQPPPPPDFETESKMKQDALTKLKMLETKFGKRVGYKCSLTMDSPLAKIEAEKKLVMEMIQGKCGVECMYNGLMVCAKGLEAATQVKHVKPFIDLEDYPATLSEHKDELISALDELLTAHPELAAFVKPEIKLALIMSTAAISTASANKQKKNEKLSKPTLSEASSPKV